MELIALGGVVLNMDRVTALDIDLEGGMYRLKVFTDSGETPFMTFKVHPQVQTALTNMVPAQLRLPAAE